MMYTIIPGWRSTNVVEASRMALIASVIAMSQGKLTSVQLHDEKLVGEVS